MEPNSYEYIPASFSLQAHTSEGPLGQIANEELINHSFRLEKKLWNISSGVWCLVGNGLSNQTFVEGPDGIIVIDTGECQEEMTEALLEIRKETQKPIAAIIYSHFHYVAGTQSIFDEGAPSDIPIWGHVRITENLRTYGTELSAVASRGLIHQFGISLPKDGPDAVVNAGLGMSYRNPNHSPFTPGFVAPTETFSEPIQTTIAGLHVEMTPSPSDADDSITIWFPELELCVNNLVWPALFNVFAIRGEEYRDPRILLEGLDHILSLKPSALVGTHGPPIQEEEKILREVTRYRDRIQFLWDQSVRGINKGLTSDELTEFVQLPIESDETYITKQFYGVAEHHVRQIYAGLRGWFDGNPANLFPDEPQARAQKIVNGFGGVEKTRELARAAIDSDDLRWAIELCHLLVQIYEKEETESQMPNADSQRLADCLRRIAQKTAASNIRNWCLTRAQELEGRIDLSRHRKHRFPRPVVLTNPPETTVHALRVLVNPEVTTSYEGEMRWEFENGERTGLRIRNNVAIPTDGQEANLAIALTLTDWAAILSGTINLSDALEAGLLRSDSTNVEISTFFSNFDHLPLIQ